MKEANWIPMVYLSVVIPVKDEEGNVEPLAAEISLALSHLKGRWECIWVDDGSTDGTLSALKSIARDPRHIFISLDGNYGQSAALFAGFEHARGFLIATLDADGQNDPADLPSLISEIESGEVDMVIGARERRIDSFSRLISSKIANSFRSMIIGDGIKDAGCAVRVFRRECLEDIQPFKGIHRFLPTLAIAKGWRVKEMPVNHRPRLHGHTKYGINNRLWVGLADTFAVRWMQKRMVNFKIREISHFN